jgi:hypothetical protein
MISWLIFVLLLWVTPAVVVAVALLLTLGFEKFSASAPAHEIDPDPADDDPLPKARDSH